jgi:hypothetical protein
MDEKECFPQKNDAFNRWMLIQVSQKKWTTKSAEKCESNKGYHSQFVLTPNSPIFAIL